MNITTNITTKSTVACLIVSLLLDLGCASLSNRGKTLLLLGGVGLASGVAGYALSPSEVKPEMEGAYFSAIGAAVGGIAGLYLFDEEKRSEELLREKGVMQQELDSYRDEGDSRQPELLYETLAPVGKEIPSEYAGLVRPGRWSVYRLNQWVTEGDGAMVHQDRLVKLVPPELTPENTHFTEDAGSSVQGALPAVGNEPHLRPAKPKKGK